MDTVTQQNASLVSEIATSAGSLQEQVINLQQSVARFQIERAKMETELPVARLRQNIALVDAR